MAALYAQFNRLFAKRMALLIGVVFWPLASSADEARDWTNAAVEMLCPMAPLSGLEAQSALPGTWLLDERHWPDAETAVRSTLRLALPNAGELRVERRAPGGSLRQFRTEYYAEDGSGLNPVFQSIADGACTIGSAREIRAGDNGWIYLDQLEGDLATLRWTDTLSAPWPAGSDPGGVRIGLVDSGLAYDLPVFRDRLARDEAGTPIGYDYWDLDEHPYDGDVSRGQFFPIRHGTTVASIIAREAPNAALVPYRYPRPDMSRLGDLVARASATGVRILAMPLGSNDPDLWTAFADAIEKHEILVIVSAGNDGRDIDEVPVYPASLPLKNMITVTSSDGFGRLAEGSNWGYQSVDIMLPAENLPVSDFRGADGVASGSSYAVPRLAALAARLLETSPELTTAQLKQRLLALAVPSPFERDARLAAGWIADPLVE